MTAPMTDINLPKAGQVWRHYKGGLYRIHAVGFNEYGKAVVIYYSTEESTTYFTRTLDTFIEVMDVLQSHDGAFAKLPRFEFYNSGSSR